jgi:hypothetical protein
MPAQNNHDWPSRSSGSRDSPLIKDARYSKLILRNNPIGSRYTGSGGSRLVLGLDYGTTFTAVAFGFDYGTFQDIRLITNWPGGYSSEGVPSQIAYGGQGTWGAWGYDIPPRVARHIWTKRLLDADRIPQELHPSSGLNQPELEEGRPTSPMKEPKRIVQDYLSAVKKLCVLSLGNVLWGNLF